MKTNKSKMQVIAYYESKNNNYAERVAEFVNEELYNVCIKVLEKDAKSHNMILTESIDDAEEELTEKQILGEIDNLERELEHYELYEPEDLDAICSLENKLNTFNVKLKTMVFDYLKKTYPKSNYADEDLTKDANYNDVFFEMVDDVRNKFLNEKQHDSANEIVEEYMDKNNF